MQLLSAGEGGKPLKWSTGNLLKFQLTTLELFTLIEVLNINSPNWTNNFGLTLSCQAHKFPTMQLINITIKIMRNLFKWLCRWVPLAFANADVILTSENIQIKMTKKCLIISSRVNVNAALFTLFSIFIQHKKKLLNFFFFLLKYLLTNTLR